MNVATTPSAARAAAASFFARTSLAPTAPMPACAPQASFLPRIASGSYERNLETITAESIVVTASTQHNVSAREVS
jgi:hypothetical protein